MRSFFYGIFITGSVLVFVMWLDLVGLDMLGMRPEQEKNSIVRIGQDVDCSVEFDSSLWDEMNSMGAYRWVVACEEAKKTK